MSKIKTPGAKKALSLKRDRRSAYGENDKASRKSIPRRKALSHRAARRAATLATHSLEQEASTRGDDLSDRRVADVKAKVRKGFRKCPDAPLGERVGQKLAKRRKLDADGGRRRR